MSEPANDAGKNKSSGNRAGRSNYTEEELTNFLGIMEQTLPIGPDEWDHVLKLHSVEFPGREVESLRRKYHTLHRKKIPTGDPNMPPDVRQAKRIKYKIGDRCNIGDGEEEFDVETGTFGNTPEVNVADDLEQEPATTPEVPSTLDRGEAIQPEIVLDQHTPPTIRPVDSGISSVSSTKSTSGVAIRPRSRYQSKNNRGDDFLEMMKVSMMQDAEERRQERREKAEDRKHVTDLVTAAITGLVQAFAPNNKKRKRKYGSDGTDSDDS